MQRGPRAAGASSGAGAAEPDATGMSQEEPQPTVSFYTPPTAFGALLDWYMGFENYHVEHHDFPDVPMYHLPRLRSIAPEQYEGLQSQPLLRLSTWRDSLGGTFYYACQDLTF